MRKVFLVACFVHLSFINSFSQQFKVSYTSSVSSQPFTGKVYLYMNKNSKTPAEGMVGIESFPCFAVQVNNIKPGGTIIINDKAISFPVKLSEIERGDYFVQAVWDRNLGGRAIPESPGNMFSNATKVNITKDAAKTFTIVCDQLVPEPSFKETEFVKELKVPSALLSGFHKKEMALSGAVLLPADYYKEPERKYPVLFIVFGYGGDYHQAGGDTTRRSISLDSVATITVMLDGNCPLGHSVYANSDNNGPWGDALVKEFIPALESKYRCNGARLITGHSSGGWTVLWLQTHYPSTFAACWSSSPDPVDFRDFSHVNLYERENLYYDKDSAVRMVATVAGRLLWATVKTAYQQEYVIDRGEQMHSFDAVFSQKGADGKPVSICNVATGEMDKSAFEHWKTYDICLYLRNNWSALKNELDGKIRVSVGDQDNFFLNTPVHKLEDEMKKLNAVMQFAYYPGDHFTVFSKQYRSDGEQFLAQQYTAWKASNKKAF